MTATATTGTTRKGPKSSHASVQGSSSRTIRRNAYIMQYYACVERVARRMARRLPSHVALEDLCSSGTMGLIDAATRFDPQRGQRFEVFAEPRIKGAMIDDMRRRDSLSRDMRRLSTHLHASSDQLAQKLGRTPTDGELAAHLGVPLGELHARRVKLSGASVLSFDDVAPALLDHHADPSAEDPYRAAVRRQILTRLEPALEALPERTRQVLSLYYGDNLCLREIGEVLGVTESRACQIHTEATRRLRKAIGGAEA